LLCIDPGFDHSLYQCDGRVVEVENIGGEVEGELEVRSRLSGLGIPLVEYKLV
jgi:hypothetical protein